MIKAPTDMQELRRRIYRKTSNESHRFWGLFVHITKIETLAESYRIAKRNRGAPGIDRQSFADAAPGELRADPAARAALEPYRPGLGDPRS